MAPVAGPEAEVDPEAEVPTDPVVDPVADPIPQAVEDPVTHMIPATPDQEGMMTVLIFMVLWQYFVL